MDSGHLPAVNAQNRHITHHYAAVRLCGEQRYSLNRHHLRNPAPDCMGIGAFVAVSNLEYKDYSLLTPIRGWLYAHAQEHARGRRRIHGDDCADLSSASHETKDEIPLDRHIVSFAGRAHLGTVDGSYRRFRTSSAMESRYPAYEQWMLVTITKYITHVDFLALYQWISGTLIRISLFLFIIADGIPFKNQTALVVRVRDWCCHIHRLVDPGYRSANRIVRAGQIFAVLPGLPFRADAVDCPCCHISSKYQRWVEDVKLQNSK